MGDATSAMAMDDDEAELQVDLDDDVTSEFASYEDYLDRQITPVDMYYLENKELARQLIEHGYRGNAEILTREEFEARKRAAESARLAKMYTAPEELASANKSFDGRPLLAALAQPVAFRAEIELDKDGNPLVMSVPAGAWEEKRSARGADMHIKLSARTRKPTRRPLTMRL